MTQLRQCHKPYTSKDKWIVSIISGILFLLLASPFLYNLVNSATSNFGLQTAINGCPNIIGLLIHGIIFIIIVRLMMR